MQDRNGNQNEPLYDARKTVMYCLAVMNILAGGYRLLFYRLGSPGSRAIDRWTWISAAFAYPLFVMAWPPAGPHQHRQAYLLWLALLALAFLHSSAAFWNPRPRHSQEIGKPIFGRLEMPASLAAAFVAFGACGPGAGFYVAAGQLANLIQVAAIRARFARMAALQADAQIEAGEFQQFVK